ncbi:MAG: fumarylacetoacetate hydrolase family protein [Verrucomicrobiota bacterium]
MKIYRVQDSGHQVLYATSDNGRDFFALADDPFYGELRVTNQQLEVRSILAPVEPPAVLCIGVNYLKHLEEMGHPKPEYPVMFLKPPSALLDPGAAIQLPRALRSDRVDYEVELAVVIGTRCKNVTPANALDYVLGYTIANDVSARDWQKDHGGGQWCRGKMFDTFLPLGPCIATRDDIPDSGQLALATRLNGETMQASHTGDMISPVPELIAFLSGSTTLEPGTVILTGTPSGVGAGRDPEVYLKPGDQLELEIDGIGVLANPVEEEPA